MVFDFAYNSYCIQVNVSVNSLVLNEISILSHCLPCSKTWIKQLAFSNYCVVAPTRIPNVELIMNQTRSAVTLYPVVQLLRLSKL